MVAPTLALATSDPSGYVEVCKTFNAGPAGSPSYQGTFTYDISDGSGFSTSVQVNALQGGAQACSNPISVPSGTLTVTEEQAPWFSVASITASQGDPGTVTASTNTPGQASVTVQPAPNPGDYSMTTTVDYTNDPVTGVIEVCKQADPSSPALGGAYNFTITSKQPGIATFDPTTGGYDAPWSTTASATISGGGGIGCSGPITVPAGAVETVEPGTTYVTGITAESNNVNVQTAYDPAIGVSDENVQAGDSTDQTIVTYTDALSTVKLCKQWSGVDTPNTVFPFTLSSSGAAGPTTVTPKVGLQADSCQIVGTVRAGTQVNIAEGVTPGTKVASIDVNPATNSQGVSPIVPNSESLPNGTVSIIAGAGETDVTYTDEAADPGTLKICVQPTGNAVGGPVGFTVGNTAISVNLSTTSVQCTLLDPTQYQYAFDAPVTITGGTLPSGDDFSGSPTVAPANVEVLEGSYPGTPTDTNQPSLTASTSSSATVLPSEGITTEVTFTIDPPAPATAPPVTVVASHPTVTPAPVVSGGGATLAITPTASSTPASSISAPAPATVSPNTTPAVNPSVSAKVERLEKQLASLKAQIRTLDRQLASKHLRAAARRADKRKLAALKVEEAKVIKGLGL